MAGWSATSLVSALDARGTLRAVTTKTLPAIAKCPLGSESCFGVSPSYLSSLDHSSGELPSISELPSDRRD